jgi:hypothetical protein
VPKTCARENSTSITNGIGTIETRSLPLILYENQFEIDERSYVKPKSLRWLKKNIGETLHDIVIGNDILTGTSIT